MIDNSCSFTGHRPNKLPGGYNMIHESNLEISYRLENQLQTLIGIGVDTFISGGALGFDWLAFLTVNRIKKNSPDKGIKNILALPFLYQDNNWIEESVKMYNYIKNLADDIVYVDRLSEYKLKGIREDMYHPAKMQQRNMYMVDKSKYLVSYYDGSKGGTRNCIKYAERLKRDIIGIYY